jgi:hypothetical protein
VFAAFSSEGRDIMEKEGSEMWRDGEVKDEGAKF